MIITAVPCRHSFVTKAIIKYLIVVSESIATTGIFSIHLTRRRIYSE